MFRVVRAGRPSVVLSVTVINIGAGMMRPMEHGEFARSKGSSQVGLTNTQASICPERWEGRPQFGKL